MITLRYARFLKFDEISRIKCNKISFCAEHVRIEAAEKEISIDP